MKKLIFSIFFILLIPFSQAFSAEFTDNTQTLSVFLSNQTPFVYQDSEGYTVVVGTVDNNNPHTSVTNVRIQVTFYDDFNSNPLEIVEGTSVLDVIAVDGQSPYSIRSHSPNSEITQASVSLLGFDSAVEKQNDLILLPTEVMLNNLFHFSGILQSGDTSNPDTNIHFAFYDGFDPPRFLKVSTLELGKITTNFDIPFVLSDNIDSRAVGFLLFSESETSYSDFIDVKMPIPKLVTISDVSITDMTGQKLSDLNVHVPVNIESVISVNSMVDEIDTEQPFFHYVQIKESITGTVEFIGTYDDTLIGTDSHSSIIDWVPEKTGLYFIETFAWNPNNIPLSEPGPFVLINIK